MELPNPFRAPDLPSRQPPPSGLHPREMTRLYVLGALLVFVLAAMGATRLIPRSEDPAVPPAAPPGAAPAAAVPVQESTNPQRSPRRSIDTIAADFDDTGDEILNPIDKTSPAFLEMLSAVHNDLTPEAAARQARRDIPFRALLENPAAYRGEIVRVKGRMVHIAPEAIHVANPDGIDVVHWGLVITSVEEGPVHIYFDGPLPDFTSYVRAGERLIRDFVEVEGVFLRMYRYEGKSLAADTPGPVKTAAVIFAKNIRVVDSPAQSGRSYLGPAVAMGAALAIVALIAGILFRRREPESMRMRVFDVKRAKAAAAGKSVFPAPSGSIVGDDVPHDPGSPT